MKKYPIHQSPFFALKSRKKLASILNIRSQSIINWFDSSGNYRIFYKENDKGKKREIQEPKQHLSKVHKRIANLLARIETPDYLHSSTKGRSYISNAEAHVGHQQIAAIDISQFYPSTKSHHIFGFFRHNLQCSPDVASIFAKITTYKGALPTGSSVSPILAFYAHFDMFEELNSLSKRSNMVMTVYVDDITFSGQKLSKGFLSSVKTVIRKRGLELHPGKQRVSLNNSPKKVTGVIVTNDSVRLPNARHKAFRDLSKMVEKGKDLIDKYLILEKVVGRAFEAKHIDGSFEGNAKILLTRKRQLRKQIDVSYGGKADGLITARRKQNKMKKAKPVGRFG